MGVLRLVSFKVVDVAGQTGGGSVVKLHHFVVVLRSPLMMTIL